MTSGSTQFAVCDVSGDIKVTYQAMESAYFFAFVSLFMQLLIKGKEKFVIRHFVILGQPANTKEKVTVRYNFMSDSRYTEVVASKV